MTWDNHGEWEMDHIIPMSTAKTIDAVMAISNYKNLQPLWKLANMEKKHFIGDERPLPRQGKTKLIKGSTVSIDVVHRPSLSNNNSESKLAGVTWNKDRQKWRVRIKQICYGLYADYEEAEQVCLAVRKKIYGDV